MHREAAAKASHTRMEVFFPDGITQHRPQEAKDSLNRATDLHEEELKATAKEADAPPSKEEMEIDEFGGLDDKDELVTKARIQSSIYQFLQAESRGDRERMDGQGIAGDTRRLVRFLSASCCIPIFELELEVTFRRRECGPRVDWLHGAILPKHCQLAKHVARASSFSYTQLDPCVYRMGRHRVANDHTAK